jgi:phosphomethylpyrimidine synthase
MNAPLPPLKGSPQTVTTGPIQGSRKIYASPAGRPDISVPLREITLSDPLEPPVRVYDPSGPIPRPRPRSTSTRARRSSASPGSPGADTRRRSRGR